MIDEVANEASRPRSNTTITNMAAANENNENVGEELIECLEAQLMEIETIEYMFPGDGELEITNRETLDDIRGVCENYRSCSSGDSDYKTALLKQANSLRNILLDIKLAVEFEFNSSANEVININFSLPLLYPTKAVPSVFVSADSLTREQQGLWNEKLNEFIKENATGDAMIYQITEWLKDTGEGYFKESYSHFNSYFSGIMQKKDSKSDSEAKASMWLYMHHIYNKNKRRDIINWANELKLTGFSLPGKPGVVHVEGCADNVEEFFVRLRRLSWKRMSCVHKEIHHESSWKQRFDNFEELCFDAHGGRDYHMDMGKFQIFLKEHDLGNMFSTLFGLKEK